MIQWFKNERVLKSFKLKIFLIFKGFFKIISVFQKWLIKSLQENHKWTD